MEGQAKLVRFHLSTSDAHQALQPHPLRPFEEAHSPFIWQHALFENFNSRGFDLVHFAVEVVGVDGDMFEAHELVELLLFEELRDVQFDAVQVEAIVFAAVGTRRLLGIR